MSDTLPPEKPRETVQALPYPGEFAKPQSPAKPIIPTELDCFVDVPQTKGVADVRFV